MPWSLAGQSWRQKVSPGWLLTRVRVLPRREGCRVWDMEGMKTHLLWARKPKLLGAALPLHAQPGTGQRLCWSLTLWPQATKLQDTAHLLILALVQHACQQAHSLSHVSLKVSSGVAWGRWCLGSCRWCCVLYPDLQPVWSHAGKSRAQDALKHRRHE